MTEGQYARLLRFWRKTPVREKWGCWMVKLLPPAFFCVYGAELAVLFRRYGAGRELLGTILAPALALFTSSLLRRLVDRPRPYARYNIRPLVDKAARGRSFPSNHTSSAFVLAVTAFRLSAAWGIVMLALALLTGFSRVSAGLHWPSDTAAGAVLGLTFGIVGLLVF